MGYFTNRLIITFDPTMDKADLRKDLQSQVYGSLAQPIPFESLVGEEFPSDYTSCAPISQVMLALAQKPAVNCLQFEGNFATPRRLDGTLERFLLLISADIGDDGLSLEAHYRNDLQECAERTLLAIESEVQRT